MMDITAGGAATGLGIAAGFGIVRALRPAGRPRHRSESLEMYERARTRILILGAGFGGLTTALQLSRRLGDRRDVSILLVDRGNTQLFYPMLWTVADGRANPSDVAVAIRAFQRARPFHILHATIDAIDIERREARTSAGTRPYDILVIGLGSVTAVPDIPGLRDHALLFHSPADAMQLRNHVIDALETAHQCEDPEDRAAWLTFVVGGGGDTGCELAAVINDYVRRGLLRQYPWLVDTPPRVVVVERMGRLMPLARQEVSVQVTRLLEAQGVQIRTGAGVERVTDTAVDTSHGSIPTHTVFWAAGTTAPGAVRDLPLEHARNGALTVDTQLRARGHDEIYVVGDAAWIDDPTSGGPVPPTAQAAEQEGRYIAEAIATSVAGAPPPGPFHFSSRGHFTLLGGHTAVSEVGPLVLTGLPAWLLWHGYYLAHIPAWRNRLHLVTDWALAAIAGRETGQLPLQADVPPRARSSSA